MFWRCSCAENRLLRVPGLVLCRQECCGKSPSSLGWEVWNNFSRPGLKVLPSLADMAADSGFLMLFFTSQHCTLKIDVVRRSSTLENCVEECFSWGGVSWYWKYRPKNGENSSLLKTKCQQSYFSYSSYWALFEVVKWVWWAEGTYMCSAEPSFLGGCLAVLILFSPAHLRKPVEVTLA